MQSSGFEQFQNTYTGPLMVSELSAAGLGPREVSLLQAKLDELRVAEASDKVTFQQEGGERVARHIGCAT